MSVTEVNVFDRVQAKASELVPLKVLLSILAAPFYVLGFLVGVLWFALAWAYAAVLVGVQDGRRRRDT